MIYEYFQVTGTHETLLDFSDLKGIKLRGDDGWDLIQSGMKSCCLSTEMPSDTYSGKLVQNTASRV